MPFAQQDGALSGVRRREAMEVVQARGRVDDAGLHRAFCVRRDLFDEHVPCAKRRARGSPYGALGVESDFIDLKLLV